ncbi:hypothetical protein [Sphingomonas sp. ID0503]|uniref:hypothetical protein n=1 Tax=Sphingomonas sp. ID0503 TaxID=3399691 RepID=UPI003AFB3079
MLNTRLEAVKDVTASLREFETAMDEALIKGFALGSEMIRARQKAKLAAAVGQDALQNVIKALSCITEGRERTVESHEQLAEVRSYLGLDVLATGDAGKPPKSPMVPAMDAGAPARLRIA